MEMGTSYGGGSFRERSDRCDISQDTAKLTPSGVARTDRSHSLRVEADYSSRAATA